MKIYKVKQFIKKIKYKAALICSFPHFGICVLIIILSGVSLLASYYFYRLRRDYLSSILANIFAGLLTGLIICMISGVKQFYVARLKNRKNWLEHIRQMIGDYNDLFDELINKQFTMEMRRYLTSYMILDYMPTGLMMIYYKVHLINYCHLIRANTVKNIWTMTHMLLRMIFLNCMIICMK